MRPRLCLALGLALAPHAVLAQGAGGVPAYDPPPPVAIQRSGEVMARKANANQTDQAAETAAMIANFAAAYERNGKPRLALFWNRQLSDALSEWYAPARVINTETTNSTMSGDITLNQSGNAQVTSEIQQRVRDQRRGQTPETFEWEFQDGFLAPFLEAGVQVIDRSAMMRLTGADLQGTGEHTVETRALQGKADYLMEVLVGANWKSSTGYELRTRILEIRTGRIIAYVNSKGLKSWNPAKEIIATNTGFVDLEDSEEDEDSFGPQAEDQYRATGTGAGFVRKRKPPKLDKIAANLAYNTMNGLMKQWK